MPSIAALRVLVALAECGSTTAAAERIHLSQSAVSKQLLTLEALLGGKVFRRTQAGLVPTALGRIYIEQARVVIGALENAAFAAAQLRADPHVLRLKVLPILGDRWLLPRLGDFARRHPRIEVQFTTLAGEQPDEQPDGAFHFAAAPPAGMEAMRLFGSDVRLVCAPDYFDRLGAAGTLEDLARGTVIEHPATPLHWADLAAWHGRPGLRPRHMLRFAYYTLVLRAALLGQGMALVPRELVEDDLAAGQLVNPHGLRYEGAASYWFATPAGRKPSAALAAFRDWLAGQVA